MGKKYDELESKIKQRIHTLDCEWRTCPDPAMRAKYAAILWELKTLIGIDPHYIEATYNSAGS